MGSTLPTPPAILTLIQRRDRSAFQRRLLFGSERSILIYYFKVVHHSVVSRCRRNFVKQSSTEKAITRCFDKRSTNICFR